MYEFQQQDRKLVSVRRQADGAEIPIDPGNQEFCDFLAWGFAEGRLNAEEAKDHHKREQPLRRPGARFFCRADELIDWCKSHQIILSASPPRRGGDAEGHLDTSPRRWVDFGIGEQLQYEDPFDSRRASAAMFIEINRADPDPNPPFVSTGTPINVWVSVTLLKELNAALQGPDSDIRRVSSWAAEKTFVYVDVSDFSKHQPVEQALIINSLIGITLERDYWRGPKARQAVSDREASLCIGDWYIFVFNRPWLGAFFAAHLASLIETMAALGKLPVEFHFRMGVHAGPVYRFWDPGRNGWNYIGDGINGGQRVLGAVGKATDDVVFVSHKVRQSIAAQGALISGFASMLAEFQNRGRRKDKHGVPWRVYEVNHTAVAEETILDNR